MPLKLPHGIVTKKILSIDDISSIQRLAVTCEGYEHTRLRISWGMLQTRPGDFPLDFLYYDNGKIVGYIALDDRGVETKNCLAWSIPLIVGEVSFAACFGLRWICVACKR